MLSKLEKQIKALALREPNIEVCGLIINERVLPCKNTAKNPADFFKIENNEIQKHKKLGEITAVYHSHLDNEEFSHADIMISEKTQIPFIMYCNKTDKFLEYNPIGIHIPYENRPFLLGVFDCLTLAIDYYKKHLNIEIKDIEDSERYNDENWKKNPKNTRAVSFFKNHFTDQGFYEVNKIKKHDIILIKPIILRSPIHCMVYLGDNKILHHSRDNYSLIEDYSIAYKRMTKYILRHKNL